MPWSGGAGTDGWGEGDRHRRVGGRGGVGGSRGRRGGRAGVVGVWGSGGRGGGVVWWGGVYADGECVWGWGGGCGERGCGRGRLGSVEGVIDWGEWVWVWWCSKVDGGQGLCDVR